MVGSWCVTKEGSCRRAAPSTPWPHKCKRRWDSGSRHIAAANMCALAKGVGVVVSESSVLRLFCPILSWTTGRRNHSRALEDGPIFVAASGGNKAAS